MEVPDELQLLYTAPLNVEDDRFIFEVPREEIAAENIDPGQKYRIAVLERKREGEDSAQPTSASDSQPEEQSPPVEVGDT